jgi:hypothetical protein
MFNDTNLIAVDGPTAAGTTTIDSTAVDLQHFTGVIFIVAAWRLSR